MSNRGFNTALTEPIILAIDTSSNEARLSVYAMEDVIATLSVRNNLPHSQTLFSQIRAILELAYIKVEQISAFAVGTGPGSFTGLRVGLAAVKGLADSLNKPCLGIDSLDLHALASGMDGAHLVMLSAGRGEAYCGFREVVSEDIVDRPISDRVGDPLSVLHGLRDMTDYPGMSPLIVVGDCGYKYKDEIHGEAIFLKTGPNVSSVLARRAALLLKENRTAPATPHYIRQSDAEIEWKLKRTLTSRQ